VKSLFPYGVQGPYTFIKVQTLSLCFDVNSVAKAKPQVNLMDAIKSVDFQATKSPPEAPTEGTNKKSSKVGGRIFLTKA